MQHLAAPKAGIAPRRTIRFWLNCLVFACIFPAVVVTTYIIIRSFNQGRASLERDTVATARALNQAVDAELKGARAALLVLAESPYLASGEFAKFYGQAKELLPALNIDNIVLTDLSGQQLINTFQPYGAPLPFRGDRELFKKVIATGQPVISDLFVGKVIGRPVIGIEVPVLVAGEPLYTLGISFLPERLSAILRQQKIPPRRVAAILDSSQTVVARTVAEEEFIGKKATADLVEALKVAREGAFEGLTLEGVAVLSSFSRSQFSGWTVVIGIPREALFGLLWQALLGNILATIVLLVGGIFLAGVISARIAGSIRALRAPAVALGLPGALTVPSVDIQEVDELGRSLVAAHRLLEQRTRERNDLRRRIMRAQEEERLRLAHDLHDQTGQSVTAAILDLKAVEPFVEEKGRERLRHLRRQMDGLGQLLHRIAWQLRPLSIDELGLTSALETYLGEWGAKHAITADFQNADPQLDQRSDEIRTTIYRVIQEGLTNIAKHAAGAKHVSVTISASENRLHLTIEDDGRGFDPAAPSSRLGLAGMRERLLLVGGELEIESSVNAGTTLFARIPLAAERAAA